MNAEERWTQNQEWKQERGKIEISRRRKIQEGDKCLATGCFCFATQEIEIGSYIYPLCVHHVDDIFEIHKENIDALKYEDEERREKRTA